MAIERSRPRAIGTAPLAAGWDGRAWTRLFAGLLALLLAARVAALYFNGTDLFFDEAQYWSWSREPAFGYYSKPPLIAWIIGTATQACGMEEPCVRLPSPLMHAATSIVVFLLARRLYDARVGALSGLAFATLPGVSLSAGIISTDVPLLFAWALALLSLALLFETRAWSPALLLGLAIGLGLNAKYAMAWFGFCFALYLAATPGRRAVLKDPRLYAALAIGAALIAPNLYWNASNGFATFAHTADNAKWEGALFHPGNALEFFAAQFGVFGPILFATLLVVAWRAWKTRLPEPDRFLLAFSLPLVLAVTVQAFLSRAHANWAAPAYVAGTVLVVATLVRNLDWRWLKASFVLHAAVVVLVMIGTALAGRFAPPFGPDPFARTMGWAELAKAAREELAKARASGRPFAAVMADERSLTAELLYYLRDEATPIVAWREDGRPRDHFELTRPFTPATGEPVLLVGLKHAPLISREFASVTDLGVKILPAGARDHRRVSFAALAGYRKR